MLQFEQKKTIDLTDDEFGQILLLFEKIFERSATLEQLRNVYVNNPAGYSFHSIMKDEDKIVGFNTWVPFYFDYKDKTRLFVCSVTSMIDFPYRGISNFFSIVKKGYTFLKSEGVEVVYAYPNDNSYPVFKKMKLLSDIGKMYTYCLPYRIGGVRKELKWLNPISMLLCRSWVLISAVFTTTKSEKYLFSKNIQFFGKFRYNNSDYKKIQIKNGYFVYCLKEYEGVRTAFVIDVQPKSSSSFNHAIRSLMKEDSDKFDIILYPGYLSFANCSMIKIPLKYSPKNFNFTAQVFNSEIGDEIWDIRNWDTNLANYDLI